MFKYWVVEKVHCFDTSVSKKNLNFRTKEDAYKYYTSNKDKNDFYNYINEPKEVTIYFEEEEEE